MLRGAGMGSNLFYVWTETLSRRKRTVVCFLMYIYTYFLCEKLIGMFVYRLTNAGHFFSIVEDGYSLIPSWRRDRPDEAQQPHLDEQESQVNRCLNLCEMKYLER